METIGSNNGLAVDGFQSASKCESGLCIEVGAFQKSTRSGPYSDNCVEVGAWQKSSESDLNGNCVEAGVWNKSLQSADTANCVETTLADTGYVVRARDDKVSEVIGDAAPTLEFSLTGWDGFVGAEKNRRDITGAAAAGIILTLELGDGTVFAQVPNKAGGADWIKSDQPNTILEYTVPEIEAWGAGARDNEFDLPPRLQDELATERLAFAGLRAARARELVAV